jgi:SH3-like domain-containing protein
VVIISRVVWTSGTARVASVVLAFAIALLAADEARAAPAVVKVFEANAREAPATDAAVAKVFPEKAELSVSEDVKDGWRRVRLPDGKTAFIRDEDIRLVDASPPVVPLPAATPVVRTSAPVSIVYVKDLDHLAELVKEDNVVHPKAASLAARQNGAMGVMIGGAVVGGVIAIAGMTFLATESCGNGFTGYCTTEYNMTAVYGGLAILALTPLIGLAMRPGRNDLLDVVNEWNARHTDKPFTLDRQPSVGH